MASREGAKPIWFGEISSNGKSARNRKIMENSQTPMNPRETVPFYLSNRERRLLLNDITLIAVGSEEMIQKIRIAVAQGKKFVCHFTLEELDELADLIAAVANHAEDEAVENEFGRLYDRIETTLSELWDEESDEVDAIGSSEGLFGLIMEVVENQLRNLNPPETKQTYQRLLAEGFSEKEAKQHIGVVVAAEVCSALTDNAPFNLTRFIKALARLPELPTV